MANVHNPWLAVGTVGLSTFSVVTTEMLPVGLLTRIAQNLDTSTGIAGLMLTAPAFLATFFAPLVIIASGRLDRKTILTGLLMLLIVANLGSAMAPSISWLLAARAIVGLCMGGIWAIAASLAGRLAPTGSVGLATAVIFGGVSAASVFGVPLGALIGDLAGWRMAFTGMALLSGITLLLHLWTVPSLPASGSATLAQFVRQMANRRVQFSLAITFVMVAGHFMAFTFVRPLLTLVSGFAEVWIGPLLLGYGMAGVIGNFVAGVTAPRHTGLTLMTIALGLTLTLLLFWTAGDSQIGGAAMLLLWGLAYGGVSVALMTCIARSAPGAEEIASSMLVTVFNAGIALGSFIGGQLADRGGLDLTTQVACLLSFIALQIAIVIHLDFGRYARRSEQRQSG